MLHPTTYADSEIAEGAYAVIGSVFEGLPLITSVVNASDTTITIAPNTWVAVKGSALSPPGDTRIWGSWISSTGTCPSRLDGVSVTVNNEKAYIYYISPTQVNILTPPDLAAGPVVVQISLNGKTSGVFAVESQALSPSFFTFDGTHVTATHLNYTDIGPATLYPGYTHARRAGRNRGAVCQRIRANVGSGGSRRVGTIGFFAIPAGSDHRRDTSDCWIRGPCRPGLVSVQRDRSVRHGEWRHPLDGDIRRGRHADRSGDHGAAVDAPGGLALGVMKFRAGWHHSAIPLDS